MNDETPTRSRGAPRKLRSFVRRSGRLTRAQARALEAHRDAAVIDVDGLGERGASAETPLDWATLFGRSGPLVLEIGFGMGESLARQAAAAPETRYVGVEVHEAGIGALLATIESEGLTNLRILAGDIDAGLEACFGPETLDGVQVFFPDPWPKKRHHKRRLVQPAFVERLATRVRPGGVLHLATDWEPYAEHMLEVMEAAPSWENLHGPGAWVPTPPPRPETKFERRGLRLGHVVRDLRYGRRQGG